MNNTVEGNDVGHGRKRILQNLVYFLPFSLLFIGYPLALMPPGSLNLRYHFALPVFSLFSIFATGMVMAGTMPSVSVLRYDNERVRGKLIYGVRICICLLGGLITVSAIRGGQFSEHAALSSMGMFGAPLYFALWGRYYRERPVVVVLGCLWGLNVSHGLWQLYLGQEVTGLAGNRNWMASLTLALAPWAGLLIRDSGKSALRAWAWRGLVGLGTLTIIVSCHSRGTWLGLFVYAGIALWWVSRKKMKMRIAVAAGVLLVITTLAWGLQDSIKGSWQRDIRPPLWHGTFELISDHPFFGVGPGQFARAFPVYRDPAQLDRAVAAPVTEHPHNEILYQAAVLGVPVAVLWMFLLLILFRRPDSGNVLWCTAHFSALVLVVHGMVDKTLAQPPTNILALICLGLTGHYCLFEGKPSGASPECPNSKFRRYAKLLVWALLAGFALYHGVVFSAGHWYYRKGLLAENARKYSVAYNQYTRATEFYPALLRAHIAAGNLAARELQRPDVALSHLAEAYQQNSNYGHLNLDLGRVLGNLGRHTAAAECFKRELALFPRSIAAAEYIWRSKLITGELEGSSRIKKRLAHNRLAQVRRKYGEEKVKKKLVEVRNDIDAGNWAELRELANMVVNSQLYIHETEPRIVEHLTGNDRQAVNCSEVFGSRDVYFWKYAQQIHKTIQQVESNNLRDIVAAYEKSQLSSTRSDEIERLLDLYECLRQRGLVVNLLQGERGTIVPILEVHGVKTTSRIIKTASSGYTIENMTHREMSDQVSRTIAGGSVQRGRALKRVIPVYSIQFCTRTQILGELLAVGIGGDDLDLAYSPMRHLRQVEAKLNGVPGKAQLPLGFLIRRHYDGSL